MALHECGPLRAARVTAEAGEYLRLRKPGTLVSCATDVAAVHGAYSKYRVPLLKGGVSLFELQPHGKRSKISVFGSRGASLHTKAFTADDCAPASRLARRCLTATVRLKQSLTDRGGQGSDEPGGHPPGQPRR